jgi:hypothetical protein
MVVVVVWDDGGDPVGPGYCDWPWEKRTDDRPTARTSPRPRVGR